MKINYKQIILLFFLAIGISVSKVVQADVLQGNAVWSRTTSYARGWRIDDAYKVVSNAVLKDEKVGTQLTLFLNVAKFDATLPMRLEIRPAVPNTDIKIFDAKGAQVPFKLQKGGAFVEATAGETEFRKFDGFSIQIAGRSEDTAISRVVLEAKPDQLIKEVELFYAPAGSGDRINLAPHISAPRHQLKDRQPEARITQGTFLLQNASLAAEFSTQDGLRLKSLRNEYAGKDILMDAAQTRLFLTEIEGKRFGAEQWQVQNVQALSASAVLVNLHLAEYNLAAQFKVSIDADGLKLGLQMQNQAANKQSWKAVFPHLGGLAISAQPEDDYYLYPLHGGLVQKVNANLRHYYGAANESLWQMIDIFSPAEGTGVAIRSLDKDGTLKGMAFRKGVTNPAYATKISKVIQDRTSPDYLWNQSLSSGQGSTLGLEYSTYTREAGKTLSYPDAVIEMHPGDWHNAMRTYTDWAHKAWQWRPLSTKLDDVWRIEYLNIRPFTEITKPLFVDGKWYNDFEKDNIDMGEWDTWWQWSEVGPFGISLKNAREEAGETFYGHLRHRIIKDPVTGKLVWMECRGEINRYNTSMGGLAGFKFAIGNSQQKGVPVQLYTSPMLASSGTSMAQYGSKYGVINPYYPSLPPDVLPTAPRDGYVIQYGAWRMCVDSEEYVNIVAQNMARLVKDTGVDAIRLDELGFAGFACYNPQHHHMFAEEGQHVAMRAMSELAHRVHVAASAEKPDFLLTAEYPGADILAAQLDGALMSESRRYTFPGLRPFPVNIFRFYFPETKLYEYRPTNDAKMAFWNAVGTFLETYPDNYHRILKDNSDAFRSRDAQPLIPTLVDGIYANRFATKNKEITLLYNNSGATSDAPLMVADANNKLRYFDLLNGRELAIDKNAVPLNLKTNEVAAIARFTRSLQVSKTKDSWNIKLSNQIPQAFIVLCDKDGAALQRVEVENTTATLPQQDQAAYIKLFSGKYLIDAAQLP